MSIVLSVTIPVFIVIAIGYIAVWRGYMNDQHIDGLWKFAQGFAIPCLLFKAIWQLDLGNDFNSPILPAYYSGSLVNFLLGYFGAKLIFKRSVQDSISIGFTAMFANAVLLGLAINGRAYGLESIPSAYAIIAIHAPFCYLIGITAMEIAKSEKLKIKELFLSVSKAIFKNSLMIGIGLGFLANFMELTLPSAASDALNLIVRAALPAALFGLGGVLVRYNPKGDLRLIAYLCIISLIIHPLITLTISSTFFTLQPEFFYPAVITAAMAPGMNAFMFANMYGNAKQIAASTVLVGTVFSVLTVSVWLLILN